MHSDSSRGGGDRHTPEEDNDPLLVGGKLKKWCRTQQIATFLFRVAVVATAPQEEPGTCFLGGRNY